jgi:copper chaperone CopZ
VTLIVFRVPALCCRICVRMISARVTDVPGVRTVEVDLGAKTVRVTGTFDAAAVAAAIAGAGYAIDHGGDAMPAAAEGAMDARAGAAKHHTGHDHTTGGAEPKR